MGRQVLATALVLLWTLAARAETSALWGEEGELFDPRGRLMDWSYAGYAAGEAPLPHRPVDVDVTDFGATADDDADDTEAFVEAIAALEGGGVIAVPAGTFVISDMLRLTDGVVLRGAGRARTVLDIPVSFTDLRGNPGLEAGEHSSYTIEPGFIRAQGVPEGDELAAVVDSADRGDTEIRVSTTEGIAVGQWIYIGQTDVDGTMLARLHADLMEPNEGGHGESWGFRSPVVALGDGWIELERALPLDLDLLWSPRILALTPTTSEVGVEHLTIRFPLTDYPGHFQERGYNAINFHRVVDSWVRDVRILNSDNGIKITGSAFVTVTDVVLDTTGSRGDRAGHHGMNIANGGDILVTGFDVRAPFIHDVTSTFYVTGAVFADGRGVDLNMDHHSRSPYTTLWTDLDLGAGTRPFASSGARSFHPHSAAYSTFWNVRADRDMELPGVDTSGMGFGPRLNFVGFRTAATSGDEELEWWLETMEPSSLEPSNLWHAMRQARLADALTVFSPVPVFGDLAEYRPSSPARWDVCVEDGDARLRLNTSAFIRDGDGLGERALLPATPSGDFLLRLSAKTAESLEHNPAGDYAVIFGFEDEDNYAYLLANATTEFSELFVLEEGVRTSVATASSALVPDQGWHDLELRRVGDEVVASLDGVEMVRASDDRWLGGSIGVGSFNDAVYFDDIEVAPPSDGLDGGPPSDGGALPPDGADGGPLDGGAPPPSGRGAVAGGCSCRATGARPSGVGPGAWLLLVGDGGNLRTFFHQTR